MPEPAQLWQRPLTSNVSAWVLASPSTCGSGRQSNYDLPSASHPQELHGRLTGKHALLRQAGGCKEGEQASSGAAAAAAVAWSKEKWAQGGGSRPTYCSELASSATLRQRAAAVVPVSRAFRGRTRSATLMPLILRRV